MKRIMQLMMVAALVLGLLPGPLVRSAAALELVPGVDLLSTIGLDFAEVASAGSYAYVLEHNGGMRIIDLSDPARPRERGRLPLDVNHEISELIVVGMRAYICDREALRIIDVADPDQPRAIWNSAGPCADIQIAGNLVYVVAGKAGLSIFDVTNPVSPQVVATVPMIGSFPMYQVAMSGELLLILEHHPNSIVGGLLRVFDVSSPTNPTLLSSLRNGGYADMTVDGDLIYLVSHYDLDVISIADPRSPALMSHRDFEWGNRLLVDDGYLYVSYRHYELHIYDVHNPLMPTLVQKINGLSNAYLDLAMMNDLLLMADMGGGLRVFRLAPERYPPHAELCFTETQYCMSGRFREYWEQNGGLPVFGYPITDMSYEYNADTREYHHTQWFQRNRFELHPGNQRPYDVLLGRLGAASWNGENTREPGPKPGCLWFAETGHNVCNQAGALGFMSYWQGHGLNFDGQSGFSYAESLALFGYPLAEPVMSDVEGGPRMYQEFERARFEWHPDKPDEYKVLLGLLGVKHKPSW